MGHFTSRCGCDELLASQLRTHIEEYAEIVSKRDACQRKLDRARRGKRVTPNHVMDAGIAAKEDSIPKDIAISSKRARMNLVSVTAELSRQELEKEKLALEREKYEDQVIMIDTEGMPEWKVLYCEARRKECLKGREDRIRQKAADTIAAKAAAQAASVAPALADEVARQGEVTAELNVNVPLQTAAR